MSRHAASGHVAITAALAVALVGCSTTPAPSASPAADPTQGAVVTSPPFVPTASPVAPTVDPLAPVAADLDGVLTTADLAHRLPLAVAIDDSRAARPQSGFNAASIVWQAPADGYETRYLMVFQEADASAIGPVRSARNYLAHWAAELDAALGHYGGDRLTRQWMAANRGTLFTDVDGLGAGNPAYHRVRTNVAPHNAYTSSDDLLRVALALGAEASLSTRVHLRPFREDAPVDHRGAQQAIEIPYRTVTIRYEYDPEANAYRRFVNGTAQLDPMDDQPVVARTVVVLFMSFRTDGTIEKGHSRPVLGYIGSGKARIYTEGQLIEGTWSKTSETGATMILGPDGSELPFIRGRIFMQVVPLRTPIG